MSEELKPEEIKEETRALSKESVKEVTKADEKLAASKEKGLVEKTQEDEFLEAIEALKKIAIFAGKVSKDKKVDAKDLPALVDLASDFDVIMEGVKGIDRAMPDAVNRRFAFLALESLWSVFDAFKEGQK